MKDDEEQEGLLDPHADNADSPIALRPLDDQAKILDEDDFGSSQGVNSTWTAEEERRVVRKLDLLVMPLLIIAFFALQLDRGKSFPKCQLEGRQADLWYCGIGNIGNALTDFFLDDVGITQGQFNDGNELLALGIVLWEIPSNFVLYRIGPSVWISAQIVAWGLVATFQAFQHGNSPHQPLGMLRQWLTTICRRRHRISSNQVFAGDIRVRLHSSSLVHHLSIL